VGARNRLRTGCATGVLKKVRCGGVMAEVTLDVASTQLVAALTRTSLDRLALEPGSPTASSIRPKIALLVTTGVNFR
jgi:molybdopterin-binding protein